MIDFETAMQDQQDLEALCKPRVAIPAETYWPNSNYGFARILKEYAGYPPDTPVNAVIPHGVYLDGTHIFPGEVVAPVPAVLSYPRYRSRLWWKTTRKTVIPSASPFVYALEMFRFPEREREGTIFFPQHSTAGTGTSLDLDGIVRELCALPDEFRPVTVCVHWHDVLGGLAQVFRGEGFDCVSAGTLHDPDFLLRWLHLVSRHKYAASNCVSGALFYAVKAGLPFSIVGERGKHHLSPETQKIRPPVTEQSKTVYARLTEEFAGRNREITADQAEVVDYLLGVESMKTPEGLLADLERCAAMRGAT